MVKLILSLHPQRETPSLDLLRRGYDNRPNATATDCNRSVKHYGRLLFMLHQPANIHQPYKPQCYICERAQWKTETSVQAQSTSRWQTYTRLCHSISPRFESVGKNH